MSIYIRTSISGAEELRRALRDLNEKEIRKVMRTSLQATQDYTLKEARQTAMSMVKGEMGALLAHRLKVSVRLWPNRHLFKAMLMLDKEEKFIHQTQSGKIIRKRAKGFREAKGNYYIPTAIEYGHRKPFGKILKEVAPIPFMRTAEERTYQKKIDEFGRALRDQIERFLMKRATFQAKMEEKIEKIEEILGIE